MSIYRLVPALIITIVGLLAASAVFALSQQRSGVSEEGTYRIRSMLDAQTASATSGAQIIAGARSVTLNLTSTAGDGVSTSTFKTQVSLDGTTYFDYNKLITNNTSLTRASSAVLVGTTTASYTMDLEGESYYTFRCVSVETGTTTATCDALIQF